MPIKLDVAAIDKFAADAEGAFFELAKRDFKATESEREFTKDHQAVFETGVAEKFLKMSKDERTAISQLGPITETTFRLFEAKKSNPFSTVLVHIKEMSVKKTLGTQPKGKNTAKVANVEAFELVTKRAQANDHRRIAQGACSQEVRRIDRSHHESY